MAKVLVAMLVAVHWAKVAVADQAGQKVTLPTWAVLVML